MKKMRWLWNGSLILFLIGVTISCAGTWSVSKAEPNAEALPSPAQTKDSTKLAVVIPPLTTQEGTTQEGTAISGRVPEVPKVETVSQPEIPAPQSGTKTPGSTPTAQPEKTISGAVSEVSKVDAVSQPQIPAPQAEAQAAAPAQTATPALVSTPAPALIPPTTPAPKPAPTSAAAPTSAPAPTKAPAPAVGPPPSSQPPPAAAPPAPPPQPPPPPVTPPAPPKGSGFVFNFDNADLYEVIRVMAEIMKINYMIDPKVKGVVNIHTAGQISAEDVLPIFQTILKLNGATAVKKDNVYQIVPFGDAKKMYTLPATLSEAAKVPPEEKYMIQIIPLKFIPVAEVAKMIKPFLSDGADIVEHPPNNILIIGDVASNVKKSVDVIGLFDIDIFTDLRVRIYPILNADVTEVVKEMERIFVSFEVSTKSGRGVGITFTPITRINSLLVVSSIPDIFGKVERWVKELDRIPTEGSKFSVFVYYVQNAKAKDLADVLKEVFVTGKKAESKEKSVPPGQQQPRSARPAPTAPTPAPSAAPTEEGGTVPVGEINIVVDEPNNALVIRAFSRDYRSILETIKKLDIYPRQVLIEVLMAEITLDDSNKFGVEWAKFMTSNPPIAQGAVLQSQPPDNPFNQALSAVNFRYSIVELGGRVSAAINAAASDSRLKVVSSPTILASNNKEAKIQVGASQPILTNTYTTGITAGTTSGVVEGTIEYKDIGIIVTVTPRISDGGLVTMEISIENSTYGTVSLGSLPNVPVFNKRTAKTILSVMEGQTIVIGGLIEDSKNVTKSGIPLLSKIPILGALFGYQTYEKKKTELLVLMTPHVISDLQQSNRVTKEFEEKIEGLKKELKEQEKMREKK